MPSHLRISDRDEKHSLSGSKRSEELRSSDVGKKKLKREDNVKELSDEPSEYSGRDKTEHFHMERRFSKASNYRSLILHGMSKNRNTGRSGVLSGGLSQSPPRSDSLEPARGIKLHDMQKRPQDLLKPELLKLCQILRLSEGVRVMAERFLDYVVAQNHVIREPKTKLQALQISLCWTAASILKCKINKKESLPLAKQQLLFGCSAEEVSDMYSDLRKLKKLFLVHEGNVKDLDSSKQCASLTEVTDKDQEQSPTPGTGEREFSSRIKRREDKLEKRMKKLVKKLQKKINEFHRTWEEQRVHLLKQHSQAASLVSSTESQRPERLDELERLDDEYAKKIEDHMWQLEKARTSLEDLKAQRLAKKNKEWEKKSLCLEEMKSSPQAGSLVIVPSEKNELRLTFKRPTVCVSPSHQTSAVDYVEKKSPDDGCGRLSDLDRSGNASERDTVANPSSHEEQCPNGAPASIKEIMESAENELSLLEERPQASPCSYVQDTEEIADKVDETRPTEAETLHQINHELILSNSSEQLQLPPSADILVVTDQPCSAGVEQITQTAISNLEAPVEQIPESERRSVTSNAEAPQPREDPPRREGIVAISNSEAPAQLENPLLVSNQSVLDPMLSPISFFLPHSSGVTVAVSNNRQLGGDATRLQNEGVVPQTHLRRASSIDNTIGESRTYPTLYGAPQAAPRMGIQRNFDPLHNEILRLQKEAEKEAEGYEIMKLQLKSDFEKDIAEIRKKYEVKLHDAQAAFLVKRKEHDTNQTKVLLNRIYAEAFQLMAEFRPAISMRQAISPHLMQQFPLPPTQGQSTSSAHRPNWPNHTGSATPPLRTFPFDMHAQFCRPSSSISASSIASIPQRAPAQMTPPPQFQCFRPSSISPTSSFATNIATVPQRAPFQLFPSPGNFSDYLSIGSHPAVTGRYLTLQNTSSSGSPLVANIESISGTNLPNSSLPVPAIGSSSGLCHFEMANRGGNGTVNVGCSRGIADVVCLSDGE